MGRLPERLRQVIVMRYWQQMTLGEIGAALGVSAQCVSQQEARAFLELRQVWQTVGADERCAAAEAAQPRHQRGRLSSEQREAIRHRYLAGGVKQEALAREYGVSVSSVCRIVSHG
jgi:DNA-directed RNA polymerase specialized sigma24 family protein